MKTIIVPTDFSSTASNAADYAVHFAQQVKAERIILLHAYEIPVAIDPMMPGIQIPEIDSFRESAENRLLQFRANLLLKYLDTGIVFDVLAVYGSILSALEDYAEKESIELVVMGITGGGALAETLIGSNTVHIAEHSHIPLIIVPANSSFKPIQKLLFACDFNDAEKYIPVDQIELMQQITGAALMVFNIEAEPDEFEQTFPGTVMGESFAVHTVLQKLNPSYHFSHEGNFVNGINQFVDEQQVDLVITVPKEHNFFAQLFSSSHTKKLAFHSHVPILVLSKNI
jgi:nucleotide-binding universal stress UspA family protein